MPTMIIRHRVEDFSTWREAYLAHASTRSAAGVTRSRVFQTEGDPNQVVVEFEVKDLEVAKTFSKSKDLKEKMKKAGVIGQPDFYYLNDGETFSS
jgi:hypothetical protein